MAKQHKVDFLLSAKDQSLSSTLSKAEKEFLELSKKIKDLNHTQADISAYSKQQQAIEKTASRLEHLKKQHELVQRQIAEYEAAGQSTTALELKEDQLSQRIESTNDALTNQQAKLDATGAKLEEAGVDTANLSEESARLEAELQDLGAQQEEVGEKAKASGDGMVSAFEAAGAALAAAGIIEGLMKIAEGFGEAVKTAAEFEAAMANVKAVSGASQAEFDQLNQVAKEYGASTQYTAREVADAMGYMGMAGWNAEQMVGGLGGVLALAAASGEDLASVSDIVTDNLTAFGMSAEDTGRMADVMAAASSAANTNVHMMGETFKNAAPVASALGFSLEDVAVATGLMANAGIKSSEAGTALRSWMTRMVKPSKEAKAAMDELEIGVTDASGNMLSFTEIMDRTRAAFSGLSEAEQAEKAAMIAGQDAMSGMLAIVNAAPSDYEKLTEAINNSAGAAQRMADIKLDTMQGQLTILQSAWEGLQITVGEQFTPAIKGLASAGAEALTVLNGFVSANPGVITGVSSFVAAAGLATGAIVAFNAAVKVAKALKTAELFAGPVGPALAVAGAIGLIVGAVTQAKSAIDAAKSPMYDMTAASFEQYNQIQKLSAEYDVAVQKYGETSNEAMTLKGQIDALNSAFSNGGEALSDYIARIDSVTSGYDSMVQKFSEADNSLITETAGAKALADELDNLASSTGGLEAHQAQAQAIITELNNIVPGLSMSYEDLAGTVDLTSASIMSSIDAYSQQLSLQQDIQEYAERAAQKGKLNNALQDASANKAAADEQVRIAQEAYDEMTKLTDYNPFAMLMGGSEAIANLDAAKEQAALYGEQVETLTRQVEENDAAMSSLESSIEGATSAMDTGQVEGMSAATEELVMSLQDLADAYTDAYTAAHDSLSGMFDLWDEVKDAGTTSLETITTNLTNQAKYFNDYNSNLGTISQAAQETGIDMSGMWASLSDGSPEAVAAVAGIADAIRSSADGGAEALSGLKTAYDETQAAIAETSSTIASTTAELSGAFDEVMSSLSGAVEQMDMSADATDAAANTLRGFIDGWSSSQGEAITITEETANQIINAINGGLGVASPSHITRQSGVDTILGFVEGAGSMQSAATSVMSSIASAAIAAFQASLGSLFGAGANSIAGAIAGAESMRGALVAKYASLAAAASAAYNSALQIKSPSRVFMKSGEQTMAGAITGAESMAPKLKETYAKRGHDAIEAYQQSIVRAQTTYNNSSPSYYNSVVNNEYVRPVQVQSSPQVVEPTGPTNFNLNFTFEGGATAEMESRFRDSANAIVEQVVAVITEQQIDRRRRSYSHV